jgi:hypothetical protein
MASIKAASFSNVVMSGVMAISSKGLAGHLHNSAGKKDKPISCGFD